MEDDNKNLDLTAMLFAGKEDEGSSYDTNKKTVQAFFDKVMGDKAVPRQIKQDALKAQEAFDAICSEHDGGESKEEEESETETEEESGGW